MALSMNDATIARSNSGVEELITALQGQVTNVINTLGGQVYSDVKTRTNENWSGASKDAFLKDLDERVESVRNDLIALRTRIAEDLHNDRDTFIAKDAQIYNKTN